MNVTPLPTAASSHPLATVPGKSVLGTVVFYDASPSEPFGYIRPDGQAATETVLLEPDNVLGTNPGAALHPGARVAFDVALSSTGTMRTAAFVEAVGADNKTPLRDALIGAYKAQHPTKLPPPSNTAATGHVKWFNAEKGFGFINRGPVGDDIYVHYSALLEQGHKSLVDGEPVVFDVSNGLKGPIAEHVEVPGPDGSTPLRDQLGLPHPAAGQ